MEELCPLYLKSEGATAPLAPPAPTPLIVLVLILYHEPVELYNILMLQLSVRPSVRLSDATGGQRKRLDLEPSYAVSLATER